MLRLFEENVFVRGSESQISFIRDQNAGRWRQNGLDLEV